MFTSSIIPACLEGHIISDNMPDHKGEFNNLRILDGESSKLVKGSLHVGDARSFYTAARDKTEKDGYIYTIIIVGGESVMDYYKESGEYRLIATDLATAEVINDLSSLADEYSMIYSLRRHLHSSVSAADPIIEGAASSMNADIIYLSARFRVFSAFRAAGCPEFDYLGINGQLSTEHSVLLKDEWTAMGDWLARMTPLEYEGRVAAYLLVILHNKTRVKFDTELLQLLRESMLSFLNIRFSDRSVSDSRFTSMAVDLIEGRISDAETFNHRLQRISVKFTGQYFTILLEAENITETVPAELLPVLSAIYQNCFPLQYDNKLLLLIQMPRYTPRPDIKEAALVPILEEYHLYACAGNITRNLLSLRTDYEKVSKCLTFARCFCPDPGRRIFRSEEYAMYNVIDIAYQAVKHDYHGEYIKLCCPGSIALHYYDNRHGTNNSVLLKAYLLNECNTSRTAEQFGMHRNTLMYRLDKIQQISGTDLSDPAANFRMLFSLMVLDYMERYQHRKTIYTPTSDMDRN